MFDKTDNTSAKAPSHKAGTDNAVGRTYNLLQIINGLNATLVTFNRTAARFDHQATEGFDSPLPPGNESVIDALNLAEKVFCPSADRRRQFVTMLLEYLWGNV